MTDSEIYRYAIEKANINSKELFIPKLIVDREELEDWEIYYVIFSHEFAKAFWCNDYFTWEDHLMQMVLKKEPLKYLEKFL